jgi:class 3 adenylate cyclase/regulation of enolase protein 1 (concanavalin A-like superfamily)
MVVTHSGGGQVITIVFVDLVNSTAIKAALPGGDMTARNHAYFDTILAPHRQRVEADLAALGGRVVKTSGDDHFLVFANAAQAARWAAALQVSHTQDPIATPLGPLQIRIGMHSGAPLADPRDEQDYIGHEVDTAKRVSDQASGGQILLSETTAALVRDARVAGLGLHPHGERVLKGIGRVPVFELLYGDKRPQPLQPSAAGPVSVLPSPEAETPTAEQESGPTGLRLETLAHGPVVGRDDELTELRRRIDAALQGAGAVLLLAGEPGIGKTRLALEACSHARRRGFMVLTGRCEEEGAAPYQPFIELLLEYLGATESWRVEQAIPPPVACELVRIVPQIASRVKGIPQLPPLPAEQARLALMEAVHQFLLHLATHESPLLLFLDDLHWADEGSLALLHYLARHARNMRLLIVGTYRDVELDTRHPLERTLAAMNRERLYQRLALRRLSEAALAQMVAAILNEPSGSPAFISALYHETEGNPFYVEEVLKHLVEEGAIYREQGRWCIRPLEEFRVPESIKVTIGHRLQRLSEESREALALAAVIGQQFSFDALLKASGLEEDRLLDMVEEWLAAHLVVEQRLARQEVYRFHHAQIRAVLYEALSLRRKARLHERVGLALEEVHASDLDAHLDELAYHLSQSHRGPTVEKGIDYCLRAGEKARNLYANEAAIQHLTAALELLDALPEDEPHLRKRWEAVVHLSKTCSDCRAFERAQDAVQEYLALAQRLSYPWGMAAAHRLVAWALAQSHREAGVADSESSRRLREEHLEKSLQIAEQHGLTDCGAQARSDLALLLSTDGDDLPRAEALLRETMLASEGLPKEEAQRTYDALMWVCALQGKWNEVAAALRQSIPFGGCIRLSFCLGVMEDALNRAGKQGEFVAFCEEAKDLYSRAGLPLTLNQWYLESTTPSEEFGQRLFRDEFDTPELRPEWQWNDPVQTNAYGLLDKSGSLTLRAGPGVDLFPHNNLNAPRMLLEVRGDFALETKMEGNWDERVVYGQGGLLVWKDAPNFLRLEKFSMDPEHFGSIQMEARIKGQYQIVGRGLLRGNAFHLRLERTGDRFAALCSTDGVHWLTCGHVVLPVKDPLLVGVAALYGMVVRFDYVQVLGRDKVRSSSAPGLPADGSVDGQRREP